ncbi:hypothetical protein KIN20_037348 [Parelaphostrongylus tenuis]|uniref:Uncharacterized protein n=1 Tax=Parelaphostrongylus tenuis TaxID=148309 RepID=A0AAD5RE97_PARTN|nr:hypothetical protein KIN20_037348 [Parelaphostrongylus tenuis]
MTSYTALDMSQNKMNFIKWSLPTTFISSHSARAFKNNPVRLSFIIPTEKTTDVVHEFIRDTAISRRSVHIHVSCEKVPLKDPLLPLYTMERRSCGRDGNKSYRDRICKLAAASALPRQHGGGHSRKPFISRVVACHLSV